MFRQADIHKIETECLKAHTDQLQEEADAYKTETTAMFERLQVEADETSSLRAQVICKRSDCSSDAVINGYCNPCVWKRVLTGRK